MSIEFKKYDQREWELMVVKSLPAEFNLEKLIYRIESGIVYEAFKNKSSLYRYRPIESSTWKILAEVTGSDSELNLLLLQSLESGAESIIVKFDENSDFYQILKDVRTDYIDCIFDVKTCSEKKIEELESFIMEQDHKNDAKSNVKFYVKYNHDRPNSHFIPIHFSSGLSISDELVRICNFLYSELQSNNPQKTIHIHLNIENYFFTEICKMRAIRVLAANVASLLEFESLDIKLIAKIKSEASDESIIKQSFLILSAIFGNADYISGLNWKSDQTEFARLSQNIQNVFKHESGMDFYKDAANGSFFVEDLTKQIVTKTWNDWISQF